MLLIFDRSLAELSKEFDGFIKDILMTFIIVLDVENRRLRKLIL